MSNLKINPKISISFLEEIKKQKEGIKIIDGIKIKTCPGVYPPQSSFSRASKKLRTIFGDLEGKIVLDIGTGTGIQAIQAIRMGAERVVACDINKSAVKCAQRNIELNNLKDKITVLESDLFKSVPKEKFDLIIANLPIVDFPTSSVVGLSLYDPNLNLHKRLFKQVSTYLKKTGSLVISHANLQTEKDFDIIENLIKKYNLDIYKTIEKRALGYNWKYYRLRLK